MNLSIPNIPVLTTIILPVLDVIIVAYVIYQIYNLIEGSRSIQIARGIGLIIIFFLLSRFLRLTTLNWILNYILNYGVIALIIVFQPEFRRLLTKFGESRFPWSARQKKIIFSEIVEAAKHLSKKKNGALIVFQKADYLKNIVDTGTPLDAIVSTKLLTAIFNKKSMLHDGAVVINNNRILSAGSILPLTTNPKAALNLGTRHKAGIGMSEESDAVVLIISEQTGKISLCVNGKLSQIKTDSLLKRLTGLFHMGTK